MIETLECRQLFSAVLETATEPTAELAVADSADAATPLEMKAGDGQQEYLVYKLDRCFVKSWSTSGDA